VRGLTAHFISVNAICVGVWAAAGAGYFWPIWVLIPTGAILLRRVLSGSGGDWHPHDQVDVAAPQPRVPVEVSGGRVVMSVLFVDIVGSTQHAATLGDTAWRSVVDDFERAVATQLRVLGGELLFTRGDEFVAGFALPAAAVEAAFGIRADARALGVEVRAGVHAGEVERRGRSADGIAMHIGKRVCESAEPGQILVSSTVHGLLAGSAIPFQPAGARELKGLDGAWELYEPVRDPVIS